MKTANGFLMVMLATLLLTSIPNQVEGGPVMASFCIAGCNVALGACAGCGVAAVTVTGGAAAPAAGWACSVAYTACVGACTASTFAPTP